MTTFTVLALFVLCLILLCTTSFSFIWLWSLLAVPAPFVPVSKSVIPQILTSLRLRPKNVMFDLGCGDGRVLFECYRAHPSGTYIGVEKGLVPMLLARLNKALLGSPTSVELIKKNLFICDLSRATHIFLYLFPKPMDELLPKLTRELRPGSRVVACTFPFTHRHPDEIINVSVRTWVSPNTKLYVYNF